MGSAAKRSGENPAIPASANNQPLEDRALKMAVQFFGTELLPLLGVSQKVKGIAPTEQVHLEVKGFFEDFNFEMEDGTWRHFEFESDGITLKDLRRFRSYEALMGYQYLSCPAYPHERQERGRGHCQTGKKTKEKQAGAERPGRAAADPAHVRKHEHFGTDWKKY